MARLCRCRLFPNTPVEKEIAAKPPGDFMASRETRRRSSPALGQDNGDASNVEAQADAGIEGAAESNSIVPWRGELDVEESLPSAGDKRKHAELELPVVTGTLPKEWWWNLLTKGLIGAMPL